MKTSLVVLDEVHNLHSNRQAGAEASGDVKQFMDSVSSAFVIAGTDLARSAVFQVPAGEALANSCHRAKGVPSGAGWDDGQPSPYGILCGRAYWTPCIHEHACIRCPMLRPNPEQRPRLKELIEALHDRKKEARERGWHGELEGIEISLAAAQAKLLQMGRQVSLGISTVRTP